MTQHQITSILKAFDLTGDQFQYTPLTAGLINDTFLVTDVENRQFILQKINENVFKNVDVLMRNIGLALPHLSAPDYATITFINNNNGENYIKHNGAFWRMMTFIPNSTTYNTTTHTTIAFEAGRIIGKFHSLLAPVPKNLFKDTLPKFHNLDHRAKAFKQALDAAEPGKVAIAKYAIQQATIFLKELNNLNDQELPVRICHNDTKLNNILFSKTSDKALCLIDLDTLMKGYFYYDFGDAIRTVVNTAPEDEKEHDNIVFNENLFTAFIDGLATQPHLLTNAEKESLALGAVFMPFLHGLRALTDYLNNNIYYKVTYENQNLDRCLSLFNFAEKALQHKNIMTDYILNKL
ncbi:aminoglycoside phosphotransferase family protein [Maribacter confluentis]|uniref:Aminoglycoside phosphotransferase family protein n=1 Tax=Maribacter confluentis TaxID=1656093 RepID=A0ABT8RPL9_9FLAO|nr:aminoglycoside phosphotransferase family protein [Maribacter confluentis]MDO1512842.1 aminoglycoside phosphotransferase family protein [Maribacter confluentis]